MVVGDTLDNSSGLFVALDVVVLSVISVSRVVDGVPRVVCVYTGSVSFDSDCVEITSEVEDGIAVVLELKSDTVVVVSWGLEVG